MYNKKSISLKRDGFFKFEPYGYISIEFTSKRKFSEL